MNVLKFSATLGFVSGFLILSHTVAIAQTARKLSFALVKTTPDASTRNTSGGAPRLSQIVGSGFLILDDKNQVTAYTFTTSALTPNATLPYHFHAAQKEGMSTSCEGDKSLVSGETSGPVITNLAQIAPLKTSTQGIGKIGSVAAPVALATPVPLANIGYLNIHTLQDGKVGPGIVCANIRLGPSGAPR